MTAVLSGDVIARPSRCPRPTGLQAVADSLRGPPRLSATTGTRLRSLSQDGHSQLRGQSESLTPRSVTTSALGCVPRLLSLVWSAEGCCRQSLPTF